MRSFRFTAEQVAEALRLARGIKVVAAEALGCSRSTVSRYIKLFPSVRVAFEEASDILVDRAEAQLTVAVDAGAWPAVRFTLVTLGKDRGYSEHDEPTNELSNDDEWLDFREAVHKIYGRPAGGEEESDGQQDDPEGGGEESTSDDREADG